VETAAPIVARVVTIVEIVGIVAHVAARAATVSSAALRPSPAAAPSLSRISSRSRSLRRSGTLDQKPKHRPKTPARAHHADAVVADELSRGSRAVARNHRR
jgi:hypothetical protein